jgi:threonyl-tRNA synthetase
MIELRLPDGSKKTFEGNAVPVSEVVGTLTGDSRDPVLGVLFNGKTLDVHHSIDGNGDVRLLAAADDESLEMLRHTTFRTCFQASSSPSGPQSTTVSITTSGSSDRSHR